MYLSSLEPAYNGLQNFWGDTNEETEEINPSPEVVEPVPGLVVTPQQARLGLVVAILAVAISLLR